MIEPQTATAPRLGLILRYFFSGIFFLVSAGILVFLNSEALALGAYGSWQIKSLTHVITLGFISMIVMGAAYQLVPVIMEVRVFSERWAGIQYYLFMIGVILLTYGFWDQRPELLLYATVFLNAAILIFFANILLTAKQSAKGALTARYLKTGLFYMVVTVIIGSILAINFTYGYLTSDSLLKTHISVALLGFILMTLIGVSLKLIPMFALSHLTIEKPAAILYWLLNIAVLLIFIGFTFAIGPALMLGFGLAFASLFVYFYQMYLTHSSRKRKKIDIGIRHSVSGVFYLMVSMVLGALVLTIDDPSNHIRSGFVFFSLIGFVSLFIVGQLHKILPFLVWFAKYSDKVGLEPVPNMQEMIDLRVGEVSFWSLNIGILACGIGVISGQPSLIQAGSAIFIIGSIAFAYNMIGVTRR